MHDRSQRERYIYLAIALALYININSLAIANLNFVCRNMSNERKPNPPGWVPPKAPYNPYDPTDIRPPEGYPSEFKAPGKARSWTLVPKEPDNYRVVKDTLKRLEYTPRPLSDLYPGQHKVLERLGGSKFNRGIGLASKVLAFGTVLYAVFFYRWNDGYDNVFSTPYRFQLRLRDRLLGDLSPRQREDLIPKQRGASISREPSHDAAFVKETDPGQFLERPNRVHLIEAERQKQEREEAILRAVKIAEEELKESDSDKKKKKSWGIF